jgi:hypothetical protein
LLLPRNSKIRALKEAKYVSKNLTKQFLNC